MLRSKVIPKTRFWGTSQNENFFCLSVCPLGNLSPNVIVGSGKLKTMLNSSI